MGFEDLLNRRLGPMKDLLTQGPRPLPPEYDPEQLYFRRAVGLEFFYQPETSAKSLKVEIPNCSPVKLKLDEARLILGLQNWAKPEASSGLSAKKLWRWAQSGLLNFSKSKPKVFESPVIPIDEEQGLRLCPGAWINLALEDLVQIHPIPFMPRRSDLEHAQIVGMRFSFRTRGQDVLGLTITGSEKFGTKIQNLIPQLRGHLSLKDLQSSLDDESLAVLQVLQDFCLLSNQAAEDVSTFFEPKESQVTWLGHASILYQSTGVNILIDPLFFSASVPHAPRFRDRPFDPHYLPPIDAVLITHADNDHFNPNSLAFLDRNTKIVIPCLQEPPAPYQVDIRGVLTRMGFTHIIEMSPWANLSVGDVTVTACPFEGEDWGLDLPQLTYMVYSSSLSIYCSADSHVMPDTFTRLQESRPKVDIAFMGVSGCAEPYAVDARFGYGNFYRDWIPQVQHNEWVQHCMGPHDVLQMLPLFEPSYVFGYAAGGADFIETSFSDRGCHDDLVQLLETSNVSTQVLSFVLGQPVHLPK